MHPDIDKEKQNTAKKYFFTKFYVSKTETLVSLIAIILIIVSGISQSATDFIKNLTRVPFFYRSIYFFFFFTVFFILSFPFSYLNSFRTEHKYKFSNQTSRAWLIDQAKSFFVSIVLGLIVVNTFYFIVNASPDLWWLWTGIILLIFTVILQHLSPIILIPLFYKLEPLQDESLKENLLALARKAKVNVIGVFNIKLSQKTKKANAALTGIGSTRRMLLGDTLLENYDQGEIETVMAHELGHHIHNHIPKLILLQGTLTLGSAFVLFHILPTILDFFNLGTVSDIASFPGLALTAGALSFILNPFSSYISRNLEIQADDTAVELSGKPDKFISTMVKFANNYLSLAYPPRIIEWLEYTHPPIGKRIRRAQKNDNRFKSADKKQYPGT
jgi:STE24 endopeptidase